MSRLETTEVCSTEILKRGARMKNRKKTDVRSCRQKRRRICLRGKAAVIACLLLAGCGRGTSEEKPEESQREKIVLWSYYETEAQHDALDELIRGFNLDQEQYEASWEYVPMTEFSKKLFMAYTEQALPDLVLIRSEEHNV